MYFFFGDIVGLHDTGTFMIGDTFTEGEKLKFTGIPSFSPEHFRYVENADPLKVKQLAKGIDQLMDEGVAQLFTSSLNGRKIIGTVGALKVAKAKGTIETELEKIERCSLLILDDVFLVPLDSKERPILLDIIEDRHARKSIILTSQLPVSSWYDAIGDPTVADAILDRIVHTAHQIELSGESIRKMIAKKSEKTENR